MKKQLPPLRPKEVIRALIRGYFFIHHRTGSHYIFKHPSHPERRVTVAYHNKELKRKTLLSIVEQSGLTVGEFIKLL